ncbi:hypothetical protein ANN_13781 [Periplaneta americana]|uniref:Uncharacterized protein n=1 Tax=Periplaneta americana TaxID=6978 RepID=A0ABQ8SV20_PERAM|nr:hypothetical protein ANN_13781 [Periplaneta americana]
MAYLTLVRPLMEYGAICWDPYAVYIYEGLKQTEVARWHEFAQSTIAKFIKKRKEIENVASDKINPEFKRLKAAAVEDADIATLKGFNSPVYIQQKCAKQSQKVDHEKQTKAEMLVALKRLIKTSPLTIFTNVWDRCPPSIVMHLESYDRKRRELLNSQKFLAQSSYSTNGKATEASFIVSYRVAQTGAIEEDMLIRKPLPANATGSEIFRLVSEYFEENHIPWDNCVHVCTDGAKAMVGKTVGAVSCKNAENIISVFKKKLQLWMRSLVGREFESFPALKVFREENEETLRELDEINEEFVKHLENIRHTVEQYFPEEESENNSQNLPSSYLLSAERRKSGSVKSGEARRGVQVVMHSNNQAIGALAPLSTSPPPSNPRCRRVINACLHLVSSNPFDEMES